MRSSARASHLARDAWSKPMQFWKARSFWEPRTLSAMVLSSGRHPRTLPFAKQSPVEVRIGDNNTFREYVTIHRGTKEGSATVIGDNCYLMVGTHLGHNVRLGNNVVIANNCLLAGYVEIDDGAVLGGGTVFHQFLRVGQLAMVRGGTRFGKGHPSVRIRRRRKPALRRECHRIAARRLRCRSAHGNQASFQTCLLERNQHLAGS